MTQPNPTPNNNTPIVDLCVQDVTKLNFKNKAEIIDWMWRRKEQGIEEYHVPLQAFNGRDPIIDILEETFDKVFYTKQALQEGSEHFYTLHKMYKRNLEDLELLLTIMKCPCHDSRT